MDKREIRPFTLQNPSGVKADGWSFVKVLKKNMFWARHEFLEVTSLLCFLAGIHVDFIRVSAQIVNTICGEEEWQHDGQGNELMCNIIILLAMRGYCPRGLLCLHHVWSGTFPKRQKKTTETKKNSPVVFAQSQITHQTSFDCSFFLSCQLSREDVPLWLLYKAVCVSLSWYSSLHIISAHFLLQSCF